MRLNNVPNFRVEDYQSQKEWIGNLFVTLNPFIQSLNQVITHGINFDDNIQAVRQDFQIKAFQPVKIKWPYKSTPVDVRIMQASTTANKTATILMPAWSWDAGTSQVTISRLCELTSSGIVELGAATTEQYNFNVRVSI